jgi:dihydroorotase
MFNPNIRQYLYGDILIEYGKITSFFNNMNISPDTAEIIDLEGRLVVPGLVDMHAHLYNDSSSIGVTPDPHCINYGATLAIDAGSSGVEGFEHFKENVIDKSETKIKALLNISQMGIAGNIPELGCIEKLDVKSAVKMCRRYSRDIVGIKVRISDNIAGSNASEGLRRAIEAGESAGLPVMVHPNNSALPLDSILQYLRKGDVFTHCFHKGETCIIDENQKIKKCVYQALAKGIIFDVGHGVGSFSFEIAEAAFKQDFLPHTISTDLHRANVDGPVFNLAHTISKFISLGMSLEDVLVQVTINPSKVFNLTFKSNEIRSGNTADLVVLNIFKGDYKFTDSYKVIYNGHVKVLPWLTFYKNKIYS